MSDSINVFNVTAENFDEVVIAGSANQLVIADFWADWCQPCQTLMPMLQKLAEEYQGKFHLAKINSDEQQELATRYGVRSLPTVKFFLNGEVVDEFMGVIAEPEIRQKLDQHISRESDILMSQALSQLDQGNFEEAETILNQANTIDPGSTPVITTLAELKIRADDLTGAEQILLTLPESEQQSAEISALLNKIEFSRKSSSLPAADELITNLQDNPDDLQSRYDLALHQITTNEIESAMEQLLEIMRRDRTFKNDIGRTTLLKLFDSTANEALVAQYRKAMFTLLY